MGAPFIGGQGSSGNQELDNLKDYCRNLEDKVLLL